MLTAEENDLLCRVEGDAPMGAIMRRHWLPACMSEEVAEARRRAGARAPARRGPGRVSRHARRVGVVGEHCPHRGASLALGRNEECGLALPLPRMEGRRAGQRRRDAVGAGRRRRSASACAIRRTRRARRAASSGSTWARRKRCANSSRRRSLRRPTPRSRSSRCTSRATGRRSSKARSTRRTARRCTRPTCRRPHVDRALAEGGVWPRPSNDKAPRFEVETTSYGMRYAAIRRADQGRRHARLRADHLLRRAVDGADPAEQRLQPRERQRSDGRHEHDVLFHRVERLTGRASTTTPGARSATRVWASNSTRTTGACACSPTTICRTATR